MRSTSSELLAAEVQQFQGDGFLAPDEADGVD